ncbi:hypothetical protein, partial [Polaromonas sp.]|uniref:hypothetical protein n=1 Tax=Polaromonas sp. TaxID=1869339 RepID=UPI0025FB6B48
SVTTPESRNAALSRASVTIPGMTGHDPPEYPDTGAVNKVFALRLIRLERRYLETCALEFNPTR